MKTKLSFLLLMLCITALIIFCVPSSTGRDFRLARLPDQGRNWRCATCHVNPAGGGARNVFGRDYERLGIPAGDRYTQALGDTDSDGDGFTNDEEFNANPPTEPWNRDSKPEPQSVNSKGKRITSWAKLKKRSR